MCSDNLFGVHILKPSCNCNEEYTRILFRAQNKTIFGVDKLTLNLKNGNVSKGDIVFLRYLLIFHSV